MDTVSKMTGVSMVAAAATLLLAGCSSYGGGTTATAKAPAAKMASVKCSGVNSCKGTSACAGHNSCKGKGWIKTSKSECAAKGGKVIG